MTVRPSAPPPAGPRRATAARPGARLAGLAAAALAAALAACRPAPAPPPVEPSVAAPGTASAATEAANAALARALPLDDPGSFEDARRGLIAQEPDLVIRGADGAVLRNLADFAFLDGPAPPTVNPSLWRQARLNAIHGLFKVTDGVWQVRGYDISNLSIIEGESGWIVVDTLTSPECAAAALALARKHLGDRPVVAVIFTHSHADHFGGVRGVVPPGTPPPPVVVAPAGFVEAATAENLLAGPAMGRRAAYMYGTHLPRNPTGHIDSGLGKDPGRSAIGIGILEPTIVIDRTPVELTIDAVRFVFQHAPDSEAPATLAFYLPDRRAIGVGDLVCQSLHNLYTLRGTKVRDARRWSGYIDEMLELFGDAEVVFAGHQWPVWGNAAVVAHLKRHRDAYRYIHDQTLRLANAGRTPREIAEELELPASLRTAFDVRPYYGTVRHNAKAVYQMYFGWYDGNPANLDPLPPEQAGAKYVEAMGGPEAVLERGRAALARGEYRWAAMLLDHLVFADPGNRAARELLALAHEQLGFQAESAPWRDSYLTAAAELRQGVIGTLGEPAGLAGMLRHLPPGKFFDLLAVSLNGPRAEGKQLRLNFVFTDLGESWVVEVENAVLHARRRPPAPDATVTVRTTREFLARVLTRAVGFTELATSGEMDIDGSRVDLLTFLSLLDRPDGAFPIVTP